MSDPIRYQIQNWFDFRSGQISDPKLVFRFDLDYSMRRKKKKLIYFQVGTVEGQENRIVVSILSQFFYTDNVCLNSSWMFICIRCPVHAENPTNMDPFKWWRERRGSDMNSPGSDPTGMLIDLRRHQRKSWW